VGVVPTPLFIEASILLTKEGGYPHPTLISFAPLQDDKKIKQKRPGRKNPGLTFYSKLFTFVFYL
jgi:hypothetical protein